MSNKELKWGCIQPLTGGMYIGARNAFGKPAAWVISYPGLTNIKRNDSGEITVAGNEYNLLDWCKRNNELPPYKIINKNPFTDTPLDVELIDDPVWSTGEIDFSNTDIVVSVPVCSGLSAATIAHSETKNTKNCNMIWNLKFALGKVKPKVYIFENAPALFSSPSGLHVRTQINNLAKAYGYSVSYCKTDTKCHDNCQRRPRTFVMLVKQEPNRKGAPIVNFENIRVSIKDFFDRIPEDASQQMPLRLSEADTLIMEFVKSVYGEDYRNIAKPWSMSNFVKDDLFDKFLEFIDKKDVSIKTLERFKSHIEHIKNKLKMGKSFYSIAPFWKAPESETIPACMFKSIPVLLHHEEDRLYSIREWLHTMGHPHDFILHGDPKLNYSKIGQNVPARTAQWIVSEAIRIVKRWDKIDRSGDEVKFIDNIKQEVLD